ncbi:T9SS type A sorting domain-containing protein [Algibacter aquimarinus]
MIKKLLVCATIVCSSIFVNAQSMTNLVFEPTILPTSTTVDITFDYSGISAGDVFEWQLFLALPDGTPNWASGRNIAYEGNITPNAIGSGTQTVTINIFNDPVDGEVFTWTGKITLGADGSDTGFNNAGNLVTISSTASTDDFFNKTISVYPNPVKNELNIRNTGLTIETISILDMTGKTILKDVKVIEFVDVSNLTQGFYFLRTNDNRTIKFIKN